MSYHNSLIHEPSIWKISPEKKNTLAGNYTLSKKNFYFFKRCFDVIFSMFFILAILSWLFPFVSLMILFDSKGPVFFTQRRIGRNGKIFRCLKFRTMIINNEADERQAEKNDYRVTKIGKILRRTNIDELPQFINVLIGDMSIIGPRPHMPSDYTRFSFVIPSYTFRNLVRPGITGLAQVKGHHGPTPDYENIFMRYHWDAEYVRNANFWLDLKIIALTFLNALLNFLYVAGFLLHPLKRTEL
jgi:putative colanic acid biosynthesis UDP-glucose lipid carrier transferase